MATSRSLGALTIDLIARTNGFERGMDRAQRQTSRAARQIESDMQRTQRIVDKSLLAIGAAAVAAGGAIVAIAMQTTKSMDEMAKMAQATGLTVEALSEFTYVANQSGVAQQTMINALGRLTKGMSDATRGTGDAAKAFETLGIRVTDSSGQLRGVDAVLADLAEEVSKLEDGAEKTALAIQVFGRSGAQLVPLLNNGREGIKALSDEARRLGIVMSTDAAQAAERFNDNLTRLSAVKQGLAIQLTTVLLPAMESFSDMLVSIAGGVADNASLIDTALKTLGATATAVAAIFAGRFVAAMGLKVAAFVKASATAIAYQVQMARVAAAVTGSSAAISAAMATMAGAARAATIAIGVIGGHIGAISLALAGAAYGWVSYASSQREARQATIDMTLSMDEQLEKFRELSNAQQEVFVRDLTNQVREAQQEIDGLFRDMLMTAAHFASADHYAALESGLSRVASGADDALRVVQQFIRDASPPAHIADSMVRIAGSIDGAKGSYDDLVATLLRHADAQRGSDQAVRDSVDSMQAYEDLLDRWRGQYATRAEQQAAEVKKVREEFAALGKEVPDWILGRIGERFKPTGGGSTTPSESEAAKQIKQIEDRIAALRQEAGAVNGLTDAQKALNTFERTLQTTKDKSLKQQAPLIRSLFEQWEIQEEINRQLAFDHEVREQHIRSIDEQTEAAYRQSFELERQIQIFGLTASQVAQLDLNEARLTLTKLEVARASAIESGASQDVITMYDREIKATQQLIQARAHLAKNAYGADAQRQYQEFADEAQRQNEMIGQSLTDALLRGFEDGKGFAENFADTLKNMFQTLVLRPIIEPIAEQAASTITGFMGVGGQSRGGVGGFGGLGGMASMSGVGAAPGTLGMANAWGSMGGDSMGALIAGNSGRWGVTSNMASTVSTGLGYAAALYALTEKQYGTAVGTAIGTAIMPGVGTVVGSVLGSLVDGLFSQPEARFGGTYQHIPGMGTERPGWERGDPGPQAMQFADNLLTATSDAIQRAFAGVGSDVLLTALEASFESSEKGRGGTHSGGTLVIDGHVIEFGTSAKGQGHGGRDGTLEDMMRAAEIDTWQTVIQAWQAAIDEFPRVMQDMIRGVDADALGLEAAQQLAQAFIETIEQINGLADALRNLPFTSAIHATFEYAAALAQASGSAEEAANLLGSYFQNYYSEAERAAALTEQLTREFAELGFTLPKSREELRALVDVQIALGEAGVETLVALLRLESAFASLVPAIENAADAIGGELNAAFEAQLALVRDVAAEAGRLAGLRNRAGSLLDRINRNSDFAGQREMELWAALSTASYEQQIDLASELTDIVLARYQTEIAGAERMRDIGRSLRDYIASLDTSELAPTDLATKVAEAERQLWDAVARARDGDEDALQQVQGLTQNALELWRRYGASGDAYADAYYRITGAVSDLAGQAMTDADRQLAVSQETLSQLQQLSNVAQTAYNAIDAQYQAQLVSLENEGYILTQMGAELGLLNEIAGVLRSMPAELAAILQPMLSAATANVVSGFYQGTGITPDQPAMDYWSGQLESLPQVQVAEDFYKTLVDDWYKDHLGWTGDLQGINYWAQQAQAIGPAQALEDFLHAAGINSHRLGLGYVPYDEYPAMLHKGERVLTAAENRNYAMPNWDSYGRGNNDALAAEVKALREEVKALREQNNQGHAANAQATERTGGRVAEAISESGWEHRLRR